MKRFHVHVNVKDLDESIQFYSNLFGQQPSVAESDYAKWLVDDPAVNFAISNRHRETGVSHLGLQVESSDELRSLEAGIRQSDASIVDEPDATCCYARSDKHWTKDPQGVVWEAFHTHGDVREYGESPGLAGSNCCP